MSLIGGSALFAMTAGMSVPLLLVGVSAKALLPRVGRWMESIKHLFGVLLMGVALWVISPVIPVWAQMLAWAALFIVSAAYLRAFDPWPPDQADGWPRLWKGVGLLLLILGTAQIVGVASGGRDLLRPLQQFAAGRGADEAGDTTLGRHRDHRPTRCRARRRKRHAGAAGLLRGLVCVLQGDGALHLHRSAGWAGEAGRLPVAGRVDVTENNEQDKMLLRRFHLFGPPGMIRFDGQGSGTAELPRNRFRIRERVPDQSRNEA